MFALELFGGKDVVVKEMTKVVANKIGSMPTAAMVDLERAMRLPEDTLMKIYRAEQEVSYRIFDRLSVRLGFTIYDVLNLKSLTSEQKEMWEKESNKSPLVPAGATATEDDTASPLPAETDFRMPIEMYIIIRAIEELTVDGEGASWL